MLNIIGITSSGSTFTIGYAFLSNELEGSYVWALTQLKAATNVIPEVVSTDRELALMNAIKKSNSRIAYLIKGQTKISTLFSSKNYSQDILKTGYENY